QLPEFALERAKAGAGREQAIGRCVDGERSLVVKTRHQALEAAEGKRLAAAEGDFEDAGPREIRQDLEGLIRRPGALGMRVARAEGASQIAPIRDSEQDRARHEHAQRRRLRAVEQDVYPAVTVEEQQRSVKGKWAEGHGVCGSPSRVECLAFRYRREPDPPPDCR